MNSETPKKDFDAKDKEDMKLWRFSDESGEYDECARIEMTKEELVIHMFNK